MQYPTLDRYGVTGTQNAPCHDLNKNECCSLPFAIENCHIFFERRAKNTSSMSAAVLADIGSDKVRNIFARTTLDGVSPYKFRRNRLRDSLRSEAIIKEAGTLRQGSGSACRTVGYLNVTPCFLQIHRKVSIPIFRLRRHLANCSSQSVG